MRLEQRAEWMALPNCVATTAQSGVLDGGISLNTFLVLWNFTWNAWFSCQQLYSCTFHQISSSVCTSAFERLSKSNKMQIIIALHPFTYIFIHIRRCVENFCCLWCYPLNWTDYRRKLVVTPRAGTHGFVNNLPRSLSAKNCMNTSLALIWLKLRRVLV